MTEIVSDILERELVRPVPEAVKAVSDAILERHGEAVAAILFYGSMLRADDPDGILDLYVLTESLLGFHRSIVPAFANALLPPNVIYREVLGPGGVIRSKVAVMSLDSFARRARGHAIDTTVWARFCQPVILVYARDEGVRAVIVEAMTESIRTAVRWALRLNDGAASSEAVWTDVFRHTYGAELRAERPGRGASIYSFAPNRYDRFLTLLRQDETAGWRVATRCAWPLLRSCGKVLNLARLAKAAFTFQNGVDYLVWKIERHAGRSVEISEWERRHPFLSAPRVLWRLYKDGLIR
jgi:hypothetical protein